MASLTKVTIAFPQASLTVTLATFGAGTTPLQAAMVTLAGQEMDGGVVSTVLVIVCEQVAAFPQASVALYVLVVTSVQPVVSMASLTKVTIAFPQASLTVTLATFGAGTAPLQAAMVTLAGQEMDGGVVSTVLVIVCEQVAAFPQASTALYVLVVTSVQPVVSMASLTKVTVAFPQASMTVTFATFGAGTAPLQTAIVILAGHVMVGGVVSTVLVIVCEHVAAFPQASTAL